MTNLSKNFTNSPFDAIRHEDESGEYWMARELMPMLGYSRWDRVPDVVERAKISCSNSGNLVDKHFSEEARKSKGRDAQDFRLSRYGCYLVAMNGDPRKPEIAAAQSYFAVKTRESETVIPAQSQRIRELELQLAIAQANNSTVLTQERLLLTSQAIVTMHGASMLALIQGRPNAVVTEKEVVRETVMVDQSLKPVATFDGMGIGEIAKRLGFGTGKKATAQCRKWLESVGITDVDWQQEMTAHATAKLPRELMPRLKELWMQRKGSRQMLIGE